MSPRVATGQARDGYVFLVTVLFTGAIAMSIVGSYVLLSIVSLENSLTYQRSTEALALAQTCIERGIRTLQEDSNYAGQVIIPFDAGSCEILQIGGFGNENRTVCAEGIADNHTRRLEVVIANLLPSTQIYSWQEVASFTACSY